MHRKHRRHRRTSATLQASLHHWLKCIDRDERMSNMNYVLVVRSRDRLSGTTDAYAVNVPSIPHGRYKVTASTAIPRLSTDAPVEVQVSNWCVTSALSTTRGDSWHSMLSCGYCLAGEGIFYGSDFSNTMSIRVVNEQTNAVTSAGPEHTIRFNLERLL